jgi:acyl-CoA oxidase
MKTLFSSEINLLLPMFYIAWSDAVLGPSEIALLEARLLDAEWLNEEDKSLVSTWSNPLNPPSEELMSVWASSIRAAAENMNTEEKISLASLGLKMAKTQTVDNKEINNEIIDAVEDLVKLLNVQSLEMHKELFSDFQRQKLISEKHKGSFNPEKMQALLDDDYAELRKKVYNLLRDPIFENSKKRPKSEYRAQVLEWLKLLADQGLGALHFPAEAGGKNDMAAFCSVFEVLGYHDLSLTVKFGVQFGLFGGAVLNLGTEYHHSKYLKDIANLKLPGCFAMTETGHGSNVRSLETTAIYNPSTDEIVINTPNVQAQKDYIGNAALHAKMAVVFAQLIVGNTNHGVHALLVPLRDDSGNLMPNIEIEDCAYKLGLNGVDNGRIRFHNVSVPTANLLNRYGNIDGEGQYSSPIENEGKRFFTMLGTLVGGRVSVPRAGLSAAKTALTIAIRYALQRRQFGEEGKEEMLIMDYPSHQRRLMPLLAQAYAYDFALTELTKQYTASIGADLREVESMAAGLKAMATWFTSDAIQQCREACGGKGYLHEMRFADLKADTDIFTTFEGDNTVLLQLVARSVLHDFRKELGEGGIFTMFEFVAARVLTAAREKNPWAIRNTNENHLLSAEFQLHAFSYREKDLSISVAGRLKKYIGSGLSVQQAFLKCQNHLIELAKAHVDRIVLDSFTKAESSCSEESLKPVLAKLRSLYALNNIEKNAAWYMEQDYMEGSKTKAIRKVVEKLCKEVRDDASALVDAFGIPEELLNVIEK